MRVALYVRRSTNEVLQRESLEAQEEILTQYAAKEGHKIVIIYRDSASGRTVDGRKGFETLISAVAAGPSFEAVLVRDVSRWGRFDNIDESAYWEFFFLAHGVKVLYVEEYFRDDQTPYGHLMKAFKRVLAAEQSREKARLIQFADYRAVRAGYRLGGDPPYGYRRVLINPAGEVVQILERGQRKVIGDHRVKLTPGKPEHVQVLQRIFREFVIGQRKLAWITNALNLEAVPSPRGKRWRADYLRSILANPAYKGCASAHFQASSNFAEGAFVTSSPSWEPLVEPELWERAQSQLTQRSWLRSPEGLAVQLRELFEKWGHIDAPARLGEQGKPCLETYQKYFEQGISDAICAAYATEIRYAWDEICLELAKHFTLTPDGDTVILDDSLRLGYKAAFPRGHKFGRIHWRFIFNGTETQDVTVGLGFSPPPDVQRVQLFRIINVKFKTRRTTVSPSLHGGQLARRMKHSVPSLVESLRRDFYRYSSVSRAKFLAAVRNEATVNTYDISRNLGWPEEKAGSLYRKLRSEGVALPPLKKQRGRRMTIVCDGCGKARTMRLSMAMQHKSSYCDPCWRESLAKYVTCPDCGKTRKLRHGEFKQLSNGSRTRCRTCTITRYNRGRESLAKYVTCPDCGKTRKLRHGEFKRLSNGLRTRCRTCTITRYNRERCVTYIQRDNKGRFVPRL